METILSNSSDQSFRDIFRALIESSVWHVVQLLCSNTSPERDGDAAAANINTASPIPIAISLRQTGSMVQVLKRSSTAAETVRPGLSRRIIRTAKLMTVVIDFEDGPWPAADPFHAHPHEQTCYIAEGEVIFLSEGQEPLKLSARRHVCRPAQRASLYPVAVENSAPGGLVHASARRPHCASSSRR